MNAGTIVLLAGGGFLAYKAYQSKQSAGTLNFYPASLKSLSFDGITPVLSVGVAVQNPSNQNYQVRAIVGNLYANGNLIGNVSNFTVVNVAAAAQTIYPLQIRLSLLGIVQNIIDAFNGNGLHVNAELQANANVNGFVVPIKIQYTFP